MVPVLLSWEISVSVSRFSSISSNARSPHAKVACARSRFIAFDEAAAYAAASSGPGPSRSKTVTASWTAAVAPAGSPAHQRRADRAQRHRPSPRTSPGPAVAIERLLQRGDGVILLARQVALEGSSLEQLAARRGRQTTRVAQGPPILRRRLAVGADGGRPLTRRRRELEHRCDVARGLGVMGEARVVHDTLGRPPQRLQGGAVQRDAPVRVDGVLDRHPRQFMPERDGVAFGAKHPGGEALVEGVQRPRGDRLVKPQLRRLRDDGDRLEECACPPAETRRPCEHGIPDRARDVGPSPGEDLRDEERVAGGPGVQVDWVDAVRRGERRHRLERERLELDAQHPGGGREVSKHDPQRVGRQQLVGAVGDDREPAELLGASPEHAEGVERRLVGPVNVLEDDDRRGARAQLVQERDDHALHGVADECRIAQSAADGPPDVRERSERTRGAQPVARAEEHPRARGGCASRTRERGRSSRSPHRPRRGRAAPHRAGPPRMPRRAWRAQHPAREGRLPDPLPVSVHGPCRPCSTPKRRRTTACTSSDERASQGPP